MLYADVISISSIGISATRRCQGYGYGHAISRGIYWCAAGIGYICRIVIMSNAPIFSAGGINDKPARSQSVNIAGRAGQVRLGGGIITARCVGVSGVLPIGNNYLFSEI